MFISLPSGGLRESSCGQDIRACVRVPFAKDHAPSQEPLHSGRHRTGRESSNRTLIPRLASANPRTHCGIAPIRPHRGNRLSSTLLNSNLNSYLTPCRELLSFVASGRRLRNGLRRFHGRRAICELLRWQNFKRPDSSEAAFSASKGLPQRRLKDW